MLEASEYDYKLVVLGKARPQGRPRARNAGKFVQIYEDKKDRKAKQTLVAVVQDKAPETLLDCPLQVDLVFYLPRPKGHYGTGKNAGNIKDRFKNICHTSKPDIDNLHKLVMDAMTDVFWRDDSLVCVGTTIKKYSDRPRTEIFIKKLEAEGEKTLW